MSLTAGVEYFNILFRLSTTPERLRNNIHSVIYNLLSNVIAIIQVTTFYGYYGYLDRYA